MTAVAATNDALTVALIELDAAWEAHAQMKAELEAAKRERAAARQARLIIDPKLHAFERIATALWERKTEREVSDEYTLTKIDGIIKAARAEMERLSRLQRERETREAT